MNLSILQVIFLAFLQGVTELFPISSLGHTVIIPAILGWGDLVRDKNFLPLIVSLHLGTSIALLIYFWNEWIQVVKTVWSSMKNAEVKTGTVEWEGWLIIIGCIPAGLLGVFLETPLKKLFASPLIASIFLITNGIILFGGEYLIKKKNNLKELSSLTWKDAIIIGLAQSFALIPGISRSGITIVAGLGSKLSHEEAARYSFLLGTPIIAAASLIEIPQLFGLQAQTLLLILAGMFLSGIAAYLSTRFLLKYFKKGTLKPFAYYCWAAGVIGLIFSLIYLR